MSDPAVTETERWFLKRGLPHFIADYSPTRDVLTRAVPLFVLIFLFEVANAPKRDFPIWLDVDLSIDLELEPSYEETCRFLRIS